LMKRLFFLSLSSLFLGISLWVTWGFAGEIRTQPSSFVRTLFVEKTSTLTLSGPAPEGARIVIKVAGPQRDFKVNKSGRVFGFLWAPVNHGMVRALPGMYALLSSGETGEPLLTEEQKAAAILADFQELRQPGRISILEESGPEEAEVLSRDFLKGLIRLLQKKGLYRQEEKAVRIARGRFEARLHLPAEAPMGEYRVFAYALEKGKARLIAEGHFTGKAEGLASWLARRAHDNPIFYGIIAVLIALGTGIFVGFLFQLRAKR